MDGTEGFLFLTYKSMWAAGFARYWQEQNPRYSFGKAALFFSVKTRASEKVLSNSGKNEAERLEWLFLRKHFLSSESKPQKPGIIGTPKAAV